MSRPRCFVSGLVIAGLLAVLIHAPSRAQSPSGGSFLSVEVGVEMQTHAMSDLSDQLRTQSDRLGAQFEVPVETVTDYPTRPGIRITASPLSTPRHRLGLAVSYVSTGGRAHYGDYSGSLAFNHVLERWSVGFVGERRFLRLSSLPLDLWGTLSTQAGFTDVAFQSEVEVGETSNTDRVDLSSQGWGARPGLALEYTYGPVAARVYVAAELFLGGTLRIDDQEVEIEGDTVRTNWSGFRTGLSLIVAFPDSQ